MFPFQRVSGLGEMPCFVHSINNRFWTQEKLKLRICLSLLRAPLAQFALGICCHCTGSAGVINKSCQKSCCCAEFAHQGRKSLFIYIL